MASEDRYAELPIDQIRPGRWQPRRAFDHGSLEALAESIGQVGVIEPIVVRPDGDGHYELIAGERRWRAAGLARLHQLPAWIRDVSDEEAHAMALVENLQREDLRPVEAARGIAEYMRAHGITQTQAARRLGWSRATLAHSLRLLELDEPLQELVDSGALSKGHAKALLSAPPEERLALGRRAMAGGWSVRRLEQEARRAAAGAVRGERRRASTPDPDIARLEREVGEAIGAPIRFIPKTGGAWRIEIDCFSLDELEGVVERLAGRMNF